MDSADRTSKLFYIVRDVTLHDYYSAQKQRTRLTSAFPFITLPNGHPCHVANLYMLDLLNRSGRSGRQGLSNQGSKGGTLGDYATKVSQLITYLHVNKLEIESLTDGDFSSFIEYLIQKKIAARPDPKKFNNSTILTGRVCLDFLAFAGDLHGVENFVSSDGAIRITHKRKSRKKNSYTVIHSLHFHHHSFPVEESKRTRNPISNESIKALHDSALNLWSANKNNHILLRRRVLLDTLEHTGARISEVANLLIPDVEKAWAMKHPMLRLLTMKREEKAERLVPVTRMFLSAIIKFIRFERRICMAKSKSNEHDFVFISDVTGAALQAGTLTNDILFLRKHAEIDTDTCPHTFRHRFITNHLVHLIIAHHVNSERRFSELFLNPDFFINQIKPYTGQKSSESVLKYFKPAFSQVKLYSNSISSVHTRKALEQYDRQLIGLTNQLESSTLSIKEYKASVLDLMLLRDEDLKIALERTD